MGLAIRPRPQAVAAAGSRRHNQQAGRKQLSVRALLAPSTSNPAFTGVGQLDEAIVESRYSSRQPMTMSGTVNKTAALLALSAASAAMTWAQLLTGGAPAFAAVMGATKVAGVIAMVSALASFFKPLWSGFTAPVYAISKGVALAGISAFAEVMVPGVAFNAFLLTMSTAASLLFALKADIIKVTDQFTDTVRAVSGGFFLSMLVVFALSMFGIRMPGIFTSGPMAIGISLVSAGLAAANLLLDFEFTRRAAASRQCSKALEWYFAQSTLFTLVWCYTSILRLLMLLSGMRDD